MKFYLKALAIACIAILNSCSGSDDDAIQPDENLKYRLKKETTVDSQRNTTREFTYNEQNKLTNQSFLNNNGVFNTPLFYNANNQLISIRNYVISYDANGRVSSFLVTGPEGTLTYVYDSNNRVEQMTYRDSDGNIIRQTEIIYNNDGLALEFRTEFNFGNNRLFIFTYNDDNDIVNQKQYSTNDNYDIDSAELLTDISYTYATNLKNPYAEVLEYTFANNQNISILAYKGAPYNINVNGTIFFSKTTAKPLTSETTIRFTPVTGGDTEVNNITYSYETDEDRITKLMTVFTSDDGSTSSSQTTYEYETYTP